MNNSVDSQWRGGATQYRRTHRAIVLRFAAVLYLPLVNVVGMLGPHVLPFSDNWTLIVVGIQNWKVAPPIRTLSIRHRY